MTRPTRRMPTRATGSGRGCCRRCEIHTGALDNVLALADVLRDEVAVLDGLVDDVLGAAARSRWPACASLHRALRDWSCSAWPTRRPGGSPRGRRGGRDVAALSDRGTVELHVGAGVRRSPSTGWCGSNGSAPPGAAPATGASERFPARSVRPQRGQLRARSSRPRAGDARPRHARLGAPGPLLAARRPDGAARARREQEPAGPVHRPAGAAARARRARRGRGRRRDRLGGRRRHLRALQGHRGPRARRCA